MLEQTSVEPIRMTVGRQRVDMATAQGLKNRAMKDIKPDYAFQPLVRGICITLIDSPLKNIEIMSSRFLSRDS